MADSKIGDNPGTVTAPVDRSRLVDEGSELFLEVIKHLPIGIHLYQLEPDDRLVFVGANPAADRILAVENQQFIGKTIEEAFPPLSETEVPLRYRRAAALGEPWATEQIRYQDDKIDGAFMVEAFQIGPGEMAASFFDVTERKRTEDALRESEENYRQLFDAESDAIFLIDNETGRILQANLAASDLYGYSHDELLALRNSDLSGEPEQTTQVTKTTAVVFNRVINIPLRWHRKSDGTIFPVEISGRFFTHHGRPVHIAAIRDISERKRAEEERQHLEDQVRHVQKLESLGVLAGGVAHDFNNILMAILGNADLARLEVPMSSPARAYLTEIERAARRAADLCRQMLAYSGKGQFVVEEVDLSQVVREMTEMLKVSVSKKAALRYALAKDLPAVEVDSTQLRQVVMNLITNASEAVGDDVGVISVSSGMMNCDRRYLAESYLDEGLKEGRYVFLEISDSGCGMTEDTLSRIFDPFFSTKFTGRGLGLAAVLGIVRGHRGAIKVYSEPGRGATFKVLLPAAGGQPEGCLEDAPSVPSWTGRGTVLLADDEEAVRKVGKEMLRHLGFDTVLAVDGTQAIELFARDPNGFECVILDLTMPNTGGEEAFRELRRLHADVRVILSSGYNEQEVTQKFAGKGLAGFVQKPYTLQQLRQVMQAVLASAEGST